MTPRIDESTVRHVAQLARLAISDAEAALYARQLSDILGYVDQLSAVNTDGVPPLDHPQSLCNVLRDDEPRTGLSNEDAMRNAPRSARDFFQVPKVLDKEDA